MAQDTGSTAVPPRMQAQPMREGAAKLLLW